MKGIYHHGQFIGLFGTNAFFHCTWMGTMRYACRVQGDHSPGHVFATHEISIYVIQHFVTINIAVVVRGGYSLRMIVEQPWTKRTNNKIICFESQVNGRRLVYTACDGFKIMDGEGKRITTAVPPNDVKRMIAIMDIIQHTFLFCFDEEIPLFPEGA